MILVDNSLGQLVIVLYASREIDVPTLCRCCRIGVGVLWRSEPAHSEYEYGGLGGQLDQLYKAHILIQPSPTTVPGI